MGILDRVLFLAIWVHRESGDLRWRPIVNEIADGLAGSVRVQVGLWLCAASGMCIVEDGSYVHMLD